MINDFTPCVKLQTIYCIYYTVYSQIMIKLYQGIEILNVQKCIDMQRIDA